MEINTLEINGTEYLTKIHFENRKDCRASIRKKTINIRIPSHISKGEKVKHIERMKEWAKKKIMENPDKFKQEPQKEYNDGDVLFGGSCTGISSNGSDASRYFLPAASANNSSTDITSPVTLILK